MKFAWYVSGTGGRLARFLAVATDEERICIKLVIADSRLPPETKALVYEKGINLIEFHYDDLTGSRAEKNMHLSDFILEQLCANSIDYCFSTGAHILAGKLLETYRNRIINFHPALLPMYRGLNAIDQADKSGDALLVGNTAHFIDSGVDTGMTIMQSVIPIKAFYDSGRNYNVILDLQIGMLKQLIKIINGGRLVVENGMPIIKGADYTKHAIFPAVD